jgi:hypothetical protein
MTFPSTDQELQIQLEREIANEITRQQVAAETAANYVVADRM